MLPVVGKVLWGVPEEEASSNWPSLARCSLHILPHEALTSGVLGLELLTLSLWSAAQPPLVSPFPKAGSVTHALAHLNRKVQLPYSLRSSQIFPNILSFIQKGLKDFLNSFP